MEKEKSFDLQFKDKIGKGCILSEEGEFGRWYDGEFKGSLINKDGIYFIIGKDKIKLRIDTRITFYKKDVPMEREQDSGNCNWDYLNVEG